MSSSSEAGPSQAKPEYPQDLASIVAIFHASFHPTKGNLIDWSLKASDDIKLDNLEFSALPSGLHLVEQDVVYFTKDGHHGVCAFRRRRTTEHGHRGFRLSSVGILLAKSRRPRPWMHTSALKDLTTMIYARLEASGVLEPADGDWEAARTFFEARRVREPTLGGAGDWNGWVADLEDPPTSDGFVNPDPSSQPPVLHLPHLLRILGPTALTLYKHILGRRRIMVYTLPPVEAACILCQVASDLCLEAQLEGPDAPGTSSHLPTTISLIDLTTSTPDKASRPTFYSSRTQEGSSRSPPKLSVIRFAWSDVKLWNELNRILALDNSASHHSGCHCAPSSPPGGAPGADKPRIVNAFTDVWRVYEDVCVVCAGLWMGGWRNNSQASYTGDMRQWGAVRLEGDDDLTLGTVAGAYVRNRGMGIEGTPTSPSPSSSGFPKERAASSSGRERMSGLLRSPGKAKARASAGVGPADFEEEVDRRDAQMRTTLALLQTFHAHTLFQLSVLQSFLPTGIGSGTAVVNLTPRDLSAFELGPWSSSDARYVTWLGEEYGGQTRVVVKKTWKDIFGIFLGY
uniref:Protein LCHN n=1 Tax=Schizophyllum commune (strain H4-8 / FGSC 9210) TaxID=578458 RepID=D8Q6V7_SCHCM